MNPFEKTPKILKMMQIPQEHFFILKIFIKKQGVKIWIMTIMMIKQIDFFKKNEQIVHK